MSKKKRKCIICGAEYEYCNDCQRFTKKEPWRNLFDSEECLDIANTVFAYRGKEISKKDAKILIERHQNILAKAISIDGKISAELKDICSYVDTVEEVKGETVDANDQEINKEPQMENKSKKTHKANKQ